MQVRNVSRLRDQLRQPDQSTQREGRAGQPKGDVWYVISDFSINNVQIDSRNQTVQRTDGRREFSQKDSFTDRDCKDTT